MAEIVSANEFRIRKNKYVSKLKDSNFFLVSNEKRSEKSFVVVDVLYFNSLLRNNGEKDLVEGIEEGLKLIEEKTIYANKKASDARRK